MTRDDLVQLIRDALDDDPARIESIVDEGLPGELLVWDVDGDWWTVAVRPR